MEKNAIKRVRQVRQGSAATRLAARDLLVLHLSVLTVKHFKPIQKTVIRIDLCLPEHPLSYNPRMTSKI